MSSKAPTDEFRIEEVTVRGTLYKFRELSAKEYDDILKIASGPDDNADLSTVLKMMAVKAMVEPTISSADELLAKPYPVYQKLLTTVNKMHFGADEESSPNA